MKLKNVRKIVSMILSLSLMLQIGIPAVYAGARNLLIITEFEALSEDVKNMMVTVGTEEEEVLGTLPKALEATYKETTTGSAINMTLKEITWVSDRDFSTEEEDEFVFTANLKGESYTLAAGVKMPKITVEVISQQPAFRNSAPLEWPEGMERIDGAVYGGDITEEGLYFFEPSWLPEEITQYKAGEGYVLFTPKGQLTNGKTIIELKNTTINVDERPAIKLPWIDMDFELVIKGSNTLLSNAEMSNGCIDGGGANLNITGNGSLDIRKNEGSGAGGYGIYLGDGRTFNYEESVTLNLIVWTDNSDAPKQEIFGDVILMANSFKEDADLIIHDHAKLTLKKSENMFEVEDVSLDKNLLMGKNAKVIIDESVSFIMGDSNPLPKVRNNGGSIIVKGMLDFRDNSYLKDIVKMNIITEGKGRLKVYGRLIDATSGNIIFNDTSGEYLQADNEGTYTCGKGTMKWEPIVDDENLVGGTLTLNNADIKMQGNNYDFVIGVPNKDVPITLNIVGDNTIDSVCILGIYSNKLKLIGNGTLNFKGGAGISYDTDFDINNFDGKLNGIVMKSELANAYGTAYGTTSYVSSDNGIIYDEFTVENGAKLTIEPGSNLYAGTLTNNGELINNGTLSLRRSVVDEEEIKKWIYDDLNLKGNGIVAVAGVECGALFTNDGNLIIENTDPLDFSQTREDHGNLAEDGYHWDHKLKKLTIQNLVMFGDSSSNAVDAIVFPKLEDVTLELKGYNQIADFRRAVIQIPDKQISNQSKWVPEGSLTICGDGTLIAKRESGGSILEIPGKFILESGNLVMDSAGGHKEGLECYGMEIKGGSIGRENMSAAIASNDDFKMSGGKVVSGDGEISLWVQGNLTLTGGELIIGRGSIASIYVGDGNVTISGGKFIANNNEKEKVMGMVVVLGEEKDKKVSISGGTVEVKAGGSAITFFGYGEGKGILETNGMIVTTNPTGGTLKSVTDLEWNQTFYGLTADDSLKMEDGMFLNASTSFTAVKKPSKPSGSDDSSSGGSSGGGSSSSSDVTITTPPITKPNAPTTASTLVKANVTNGTANVTVSQSTVADAIAKAQAEAKKNDTETNGIAVEIKVDTKNTKASNISANLPKETVDELAKSGVKELSIKSDIGIISLDLETLKIIQDEINSDVTVSAKRVDSNTLSAEAQVIIGNRPVFDFSITGANGQKVRDFGKGKVSISIPYTLGENEKAENVRAYYIDDEGKTYEVPNSVYDEKTGMVFFATDHFSKFAVGCKEDELEDAGPDTPPVTFTDIASHWAKKDIEFVTARGLFGGTAEGIFSPNMSMTRGMLVTVLGRLDKADLSSYIASSFEDVKSDAYYMSAIEWAKENGIVSGISASEFAPNQAITREQLAVIIANYAKANGFELPGLQIESSFADYEKISDYAKVAVKQMQMAGIIAGREDNIFDPKGTATRAEVSAVLKRLIELIEEK